jgi:quercetin dioxygenase-like cupin family protein
MSTLGTGSDVREFVVERDVRVTILTTAAETEGRHDLIEARQGPGATTPLHLHTRYEERIWVVSGGLTVWAGEDTFELGSGDFQLIPRHVPHAIKAGPEGSHALLVTSPAGFAELVARAGVPAHLAEAGAEFDLDEFMKVTTELGDVVLGPPGTLPGDVSPG